MKLAIINSVTYGSTGKIARQLNEMANKNGINSYLFVPRGRHNKKSDDKTIITFGSRISEDSHLILGKLTGLHGVFSRIATCNLVKKMKKLNINCVHLHNLHNDYINLKTLFKYLKKNNIRVIWTFHDCWPFTGRCPHFIVYNCEKWKTGCYKCKFPLKSYPDSFVRKEKWNWNFKRKIFTSLDNLTIVTPSKWLAGLVKQSFLSSYDVKVINNGIDLKTFHYSKNDFKEKHNLLGKHVILGVAFDWGYRKGLDIFIEISKKLPENYAFVLVGTNEKIDDILPKGFISIHKTENQESLASIYSSCDVLFNPTREDNYPTVNMEAISCGLPVVTFNTGGSPEIISDSTGLVVTDNSITGSISAIREVCEGDKFDRSQITKFAERFDKSKRFEEYISLYKESNK